jgi:hypothetical protein
MEMERLLKKYGSVQAVIDNKFHLEELRNIGYQDFCLRAKNPRTHGHGVTMSPEDVTGTNTKRQGR